MKFLKFQNFTLDAMSDRNNFAEKFSREKGLEFLKFQSFALVATGNNSWQKFSRSLKFSEFQSSFVLVRRNTIPQFGIKEENYQSFTHKCES